MEELAVLKAVGENPRITQEAVFIVFLGPPSMMIFFIFPLRETAQGDRTPCLNEYDKFLFSDSALSIYSEDQVYTLGYTYDRENNTLNWGAKSFIVEKHTSKELVLIDDTSIYHKWDYWYVVTLKKR